MNEKSVKNIVKKIINIDDFQVERVKYEDYDGYYNVWKIITHNDSFILKQSKIQELNNYKLIKSNSLPKLYGYTKYYNKLYILIEFIIGNNLNVATRNNIVQTLNSLIDIQKQYWNYKEVIGVSFLEKLEKVYKRKEYLKDNILEKAYDKFIDVFKLCDKTFTHDDLLPFNVIVSDDECKLIDLEYVGILPYPLSICRLITHCKEEKDYIFYMSENDKLFAIDYYYNNYINNYNISYKQYINTIKYFMFYEFTEWVFVYNKYQAPKDQRFEYYYYNSKKLAEEILEGLYD